jgi:hypothetical protein
MIDLGIAITAATAAALVTGFFRSLRVRAFPGYGWLGLVALGSAEWLMFHHIEPVWTYFTPMAWSAYILIADGAVLALTGRSRLHDSPITLARMALLSIPLWLIFEGYNWRLDNWTYVGVPPGWAAIVFGYGWSFATITPAIFETSDLVQGMLPTLPGRPIKFPRATETVLILIGAACLILPLVLPLRIAERLFVLVWLGFVLLLDPLNRKLALPSFIGDLSEGFRRRLYGFFAAGWVCGWFWEFWNNWAGAKWHYTFPMFQNTKIFEMPAPGFLGFLPFALECFAMYVTAAGLIGWIKRVK